MQNAPIEFRPPTGDAPALLPPERDTIFARRAERFATLAKAHSLGDWLGFLGRLTQAQHAALAALSPLPLPSDERIAQATEHAMPPLNPVAIERPAAWREVLTTIVTRLETDAPAAAAATLADLKAATAEQLDARADALLAGQPLAGHAAESPYLAAALQVAWTALAADLAGRHPPRLDNPGLCPCCGSPAVASIVRLGPTVNNLRYLHCSLCNSEWNIPRAVCTGCGSDAQLAYRQLETADGQLAAAAVRAETCDECQGYLKIGFQDKDPDFDPVADDLATLALDLLVDEAGYGRCGPNWLLANAASDA